MPEPRTDPLVPVLGVAVSIVMIAAVGFIFYPRISHWLAPSRDSVVGAPPSPTTAVPVWVCGTEKGVALMLESSPDGGADSALAGALAGGPHFFLTLTVYNFDGPETYRLGLPEAGLVSPEGGPNVIGAFYRRKPDAPPHLRGVLDGLGAVREVAVPKGRSGQLLLVVPADPSRRTAFVTGPIRFVRRELERQVLASWRQHPDLEEFKDF